MAFNGHYCGICSLITSFAHPLWLFIHPILVYIPFSIALIVLAICAAAWKKWSFTREYNSIQEKSYLLIQAQQLEEIAESKTVEVFPDVQAELLKAAAKKYEELEDFEKASKLQLKGIVLG